MNARQINYLHPSPALLERARREQAAIDAKVPKTLFVELPVQAFAAFASEAEQKAERARAKSTDLSKAESYREHWTERAAFWTQVEETLSRSLNAAGVRR